MSRPKKSSAPRIEDQPASGAATSLRAVLARRPRALDVATVVLFVAACAAPAVGALLRPGAAAESVRGEQRTPAATPSLPRTLRAAARIPRELKAWHDDHLGWRDLVLQLRSRLLWYGLGVSPAASAVIGDDDWLWYAGESSMDAWRGASPLRPSHVEGWTRVFRDRAEWCRARGFVYVAALAPNKMEVYTERVPRTYRKVGPSRYDQISVALAAEPGGWFVDLRAELRSERERDTVDDYTYSRRGTHWSTRAALRGGAAILARVREAGGTVEIPERSDFEFVPMAFDDDGWRGQLHLPDLEKEVQPLLGRNLARPWRPTERLDAVPKRVETMTGVDALPRAWFVHDSFGAILRPMLAPFFAHVVHDWKPLGDFDSHAMIEFAPDFVIDLHTERQIFRDPPDLIASLDQDESKARFERADAPIWTLADSALRAVSDDDLSLSGNGDGLVLEAHRSGAGVVFPDADLSVRGTPILRLAIDSERGAFIYVQWQLHGQSTWRMAPAVRRKITSGTQELLIEILDTDARGPFRISPEVAAGSVRLTAAEIRSASW